jgi:hypothetical protein
MKYQDVIDLDWPETKITGQTKINSRYIRGDVRASLGMYPTDEELEQWMKKSLERELP